MTVPKQQRAAPIVLDLCAHCGHPRSDHLPGVIYTASLPAICRSCCCYDFEETCDHTEAEKRHTT